VTGIRKREGSISQIVIFRAALILGAGALATACAEKPAPVAHTAVPAAPAAKQIYVVVERGQTLDQIARNYRVAKQDIIAANQLKPPYELKPGTVLTLPAGAAQPPKEATQSKPALPAKAAAKPDQAAAIAGSARPTRPKRPPPKAIPLD
jgi:LysM repeat protein